MNFRKNKRKLIIAEVGQSHNGSFNQAKKLIDLTVRAGADVIKFQTHYADAESTLNEKFRKGYNFKQKNRLEYWKKHEFSKEKWSMLRKYCKKKKILFSSSPFSEKAFDVLNKLDIDIWKIGSGEFFSERLNELIFNTKKPVIISTGLSNWNDIRNKIRRLKKKRANFLIMQCTTKYPLPLNEVGMNIINEIKEKFNCPVGLSDHSGTIYPILMGLSDNITQAIEVHVSKPQNKNNPDKSSSLTFKELKFVCDYRKKIEILKSSKLDKNLVSSKLKKTKVLFTKSICLRENYKKGHRILVKDICFKKPGNGISTSQINKIVNKKLSKNYSNKRLLRWSDLEK